MPCEDFEIVVGKNTVQVVYDFELRRVCWHVLEGPATGDVVCYGWSKIFVFRDFINERRDRSITGIVNEFQRFFGIRRQRAFWIVESMLDSRWCVLEVVITPHCVIFSDGEYTTSPLEYAEVFESVADTDDVYKVFKKAMQDNKIRILTQCGKDAKYGIDMRRAKLEETIFEVVRTDYEDWIRETVAEIASWQP